MAQWDLVISVVIEHKWKELWNNTVKINDDILWLIREREFWLSHHLEKIWGVAIKSALQKYDSKQWKK